MARRRFRFGAKSKFICGANFHFCVGVEIQFRHGAVIQFRIYRQNHLVRHICRIAFSLVLVLPKTHLPLRTVVRRESEIPYWRALSFLLRCGNAISLRFYFGARAQYLRAAHMRFYVGAEMRFRFSPLAHLCFDSITYDRDRPTKNLSTRPNSPI